MWGPMRIGGGFASREVGGVGALRKGLMSSKVGMKVMTTHFGRFVASGLMDNTVSKLAHRGMGRRSVRMT